MFNIFKTKEEREEKRREKERKREEKRKEKERRREEKRNPKEYVPPPPMPIDGPISNPNRKLKIPDDCFKMDLACCKPLDRRGSDNPLNIVKVGHGKSEKLHEMVELDGEQVLRVMYPKRSYKPSAEPEGGIGFYASPKEIFPCDEVTLSYDMYFEGNFDPNLGGKLPGLFMGPPGASGGRHSDKNGSCRLMWRKASGEDGIESEAYVYASKSQSKEYEEIPGLVVNKKYGDSLWRGEGIMKKGQWNNILIYCKSNTKGNNDGIVKLTVNGQEFEYNKMKWTTDEVKMQGVTFDTFFGGGAPKWASPVDTSIYFKNIMLFKNQPEYEDEEPDKPEDEEPNSEDEESEEPEEDLDDILKDPEDSEEDLDGISDDSEEESDCKCCCCNCPCKENELKN